MKSSGIVVHDISLWLFNYHSTELMNENLFVIIRCSMSNNMKLVILKCERLKWCGSNQKISLTAFAFFGFCCASVILTKYAWFHLPITHEWISSHCETWNILITMRKFVLKKRFSSKNNSFSLHPSPISENGMRNCIWYILLINVCPNILIPYSVYDGD